MFATIIGIVLFVLGVIGLHSGLRSKFYTMKFIVEGNMFSSPFFEFGISNRRLVYQDVEIRVVTFGFVFFNIIFEFFKPVS